MMLSDMIAQMIEEMLVAEGGSLELRRNDLAEKIGCVPSQINYVITSRFTPEKGYIIESRRGGGGYVRITKKAFDKDKYLMHLFFGIGDAIEARACTACLENLMAENVLTQREAALMNAALNSLASDSARAEMFRRLLLVVMK
ncbi:MAG: CtsR family transcriptional regulator [Clostridia bacterium]|nr:CtsR family transcriptional regulator [Clostridia bacterium]